MLQIARSEWEVRMFMGGYGHSRIQETVLGGVTREMLRCMTLPVAMSH